MLETFPCPKCGRTLNCSGSVTDAERGECAVFQCDECIVSREMFGEKFDTALTFCVDANARVFDPGADDGELTF